jgi:pSer/pThr/pTyr-binding forkhead associated (FHA) protein
VSDPLIARFAEQCGAVVPLDLRVDLADGGLLAEGTVQQPFTLVGRDDACDVTLTDPDVNPRHLWVQTVGGRVFAVDLGSRTGLRWPDGTLGPGWLDVGRPVAVGPFRVHLRTPVSPRAVAFPAGYNPLQSDTALNRSRPSVSLEFRNGKRAKDRWNVNRLITLIGRSPDCKIHLNADDIASYHCGLVLTVGGLWMVDLSGRGVVVNGERMRVSPLPHGAQMWVGRFLIACSYPGLVHTPAVGQPGLVTPPTPLPFPAPRTLAEIPDAADEEVQLGESVSEADNLPNSHIFADAFRFLSESVGQSHAGPISHSILVSGSLPTPTAIPIPPDVRPVTLPPPQDLTKTAEVAVPDMLSFPVLRQLGLVHGQMIEQFQQSQLLMSERVLQLSHPQIEELQSELARIGELNTELLTLQESALKGTPIRHVSPDSRTPLPDEMPRRTLEGTSSAATALRDWVFERLGQLQHERHTRWGRVLALVTGNAKPAS